MRKSWESLLIFSFCTNNAANIVYCKTARCLKIVSRYKHEEATQWTHLCWFAIDSTSKFHVEGSSICHRNYIHFDRRIYVEIMTSVRRGYLDVDSTFKIDEMLMSSLRGFFYVILTSNRRNFCTRCFHSIIF